MVTTNEDYGFVQCSPYLSGGGVDFPNWKTANGASEFVVELVGDPKLNAVCGVEELNAGGTYDD